MTVVWRARDRALRRELGTATVFVDRNFDRARLGDMPLRGYDFRDSSFVNADLTGCDLREAILTGCNFTGARLTGVQFDRADLRRARLDHATLFAAELRGAWMDGVSARGILYDWSTIWPNGFRPPRPKLGLFHGARWDDD